MILVVKIPPWDYFHMLGDGSRGGGRLAPRYGCCGSLLLFCFNISVAIAIGALCISNVWCGWFISYYLCRRDHYDVFMIASR